MGVISIKKNQCAAIKILFQTSLSPLGVYSYMEVTKSVQDGIVGSTDGLSLNLSDYIIVFLIYGFLRHIHNFL